MKIKIILAAVFMTLLAYFFLNEKNKCILDTQTLSSEGYELIQLNENDYEIIFFGELGQLKQNITLDERYNIKAVKETRLQYDKPFHLDDSRVKTENVKFFTINNLSEIENFEILNSIFNSCKKSI